MKHTTSLLFFLLVGIVLIFSGCIQSDVSEHSRFVTPGNGTYSYPAQTPPVSGNESPDSLVTSVIVNAPSLSTAVTPVLLVNYSEIAYIGIQDPSDPVDENRKNIVAQAAIADARVRAILLDGGMIEGVLLQCHPTPKDSGGSACALALRVLHEESNWDFLVDEKTREVIFVQHEVLPGRI